MESCQYRLAVPPTQIKEELVPAKTADKCSQDHPMQSQVSPMGGEATQYQYGFTLKESTNEDNQITISINEGFQGYHTLYILVGRASKSMRISQCHKFDEFSVKFSFTVPQ
jgi:hypothetical protein